MHHDIASLSQLTKSLSARDRCWTVCISLCDFLRGFHRWCLRQITFSRLRRSFRSGDRHSDKPNLRFHFPSEAAGPLRDDYKSGSWSNKVLDAVGAGEVFHVHSLLGSCCKLGFCGCGRFCKFGSLPHLSTFLLGMHMANITHAAGLDRYSKACRQSLHEHDWG